MSNAPIERRGLGIHPLSWLLTVALDLAVVPAGDSGNPLAIGLGIGVLFPLVCLVQRFLARDRWINALVKSACMMFLVMIPTPVMTVLGSGVSAANAIFRAPKKLLGNSASKNLPAEHVPEPDAVPEPTEFKKPAPARRSSFESLADVVIVLALLGVLITPLFLGRSFIKGIFAPQPDEVRHRFLSEGAPTLAADGRLLLAEYVQQERIEQQYLLRHRLLGDEDWTASASIPVIYRYAVSADPMDWQVDIRRYRLDSPLGPKEPLDIIELVVPALEPVLPPAIDTSKLSLELTKERFSLRNRDAFRDSVLVSITPVVAERAGDATHMKIAREEARAAVGKLFLDWYTRLYPDVDQKFSRVVVRFADESEDTPDASPGPER